MPQFEFGAFYDKELDARGYGGFVELSLPIWNWNSGDVARARDEARAQIAFYYTTTMYHSILDVHGWGERGQAIAAAFGIQAALDDDLRWRIVRASHEGHPGLAVADDGRRSGRVGVGYPNGIATATGVDGTGHTQAVEFALEMPR